MQGALRKAYNITGAIAQLGILAGIYMDIYMTTRGQLETGALWSTGALEHWLEQWNAELEYKFDNMLTTRGQLEYWRTGKLGNGTGKLESWKSAKL